MSTKKIKHIKKQYERQLNERVAAILKDPNAVAFFIGSINGIPYLANGIYCKFGIFSHISDMGDMYVGRVDPELKKKLLYPYTIPDENYEDANLQKLLNDRDSKLARLLREIRPEDSRAFWNTDWLKVFNGESVHIECYQYGFFSDDIRINTFYNTVDGEVVKERVEHTTHWHPQLNGSNLSALEKLLKIQQKCSKKESESEKKHEEKELYESLKKLMP